MVFFSTLSISTSLLGLGFIFFAAIRVLLFYCYFYLGNHRLRFESRQLIDRGCGEKMDRGKRNRRPPPNTKPITRPRPRPTSEEYSPAGSQTLTQIAANIREQLGRLYIYRQFSWVTASATLKLYRKACQGKLDHIDPLQVDKIPAHLDLLTNCHTSMITPDLRHQRVAEPLIVTVNYVFDENLGWWPYACMFVRTQDWFLVRDVETYLQLWQIDVFICPHSSMTAPLRPPLNDTMLGLPPNVHHRRIQNVREYRSKVQTLLLDTHSVPMVKGQFFNIAAHGCCSHCSAEFKAEVVDFGHDGYKALVVTRWIDLGDGTGGLYCFPKRRRLYTRSSFTSFSVHDALFEEGSMAIYESQNRGRDRWTPKDPRALFNWGI